MQTYLYLSLIPEALILSHLPPEQFGKYLAIGAKKQTESPAIFFAVDPSFRSDAFRIDDGIARLKPHADGSGRRSIYVSVYHVLANIPVRYLQSLYLVTAAGFTLRLEASPYVPEETSQLYLYQELCPVTPRVASQLEPRAFAANVTDPANPIYLPRVVFADMKIDGLARDPARGSADNLPYKNVEHLRSCLQEIQEHPDKATKIVVRDMRPDILYFMIRSGLFVGDQQDFRYYPLPGEDELASDHHLWWHSARTASRY